MRRHPGWVKLRVRHNNNDIMARPYMSYDISSLRKFVSPEIIFGAGSRKAVANFASNFGARHVFLVSDPRVEKAGWVAEIMDIVNNELAPLKEHFQFPAGIVATGGGVRLEGVTDLMKEHMKLPVQTGMPRIDLLEIANPTHENLVYDPEFATAIGLVLIGDDEKRKKRTGAIHQIKKVIKNLIP